MPDFIQHLRTNLDGLCIPSESGKPFKAFRWPSTAGSALDAVQKQTRAEVIRCANFIAHSVSQLREIGATLAPPKYPTA